MSSPGELTRTGRVDASCPTCNTGTLLLVGRPGRVVSHEGAPVEIPRDFLIPTCSDCGREKLEDELARALSELLANSGVAAGRSALTEKMAVLQPPRPVDATLTFARPAAPVSISPGDVIGCYEILRLLGAGGMGAVYEAHDRLLNRRVAIKVAQSTSPELSLRKEAQALAAIRHPSMVAVHALGSHCGVEYLVMELVRGTTLASHVQKQLRKQQPFTVREALDILIGIAEGLAAVHASGISHRDIKPANIMLAPGNRTVLMDFGLFTPEFERLETVAGSPEYMAPEVYAARVEAGAGHLVDLYALGIIAFELLCGRPPYQGANAIQTLGMHVHEPIPSLAAEREDVPGELASLVGELLAKAPSDRPHGIEDVLGRLRALRTRTERRSNDRFSVLIVDDDPDFAESMRAVVRAELPEADVNIARDGEAAFASLLKQVPTVMLLDLNMPRMNGLELCMTLRGSGLAAKCHIVSMSAPTTAKDRELLDQLGVRDIFTKDRHLPRTIVDLVKSSKRRWQMAAGR
ncbi:MAG: Serine/threonine-protein kinase PknA [Myxococcales bacterium]|nr:Serine/threonine-protein kinase PknA [Myxococcales bacterium]